VRRNHNSHLTRFPLKRLRERRRGRSCTAFTRFPLKTLRERRRGRSCTAFTRFPLKTLRERRRGCSPPRDDEGVAHHLGTTVGWSPLREPRGWSSTIITSTANLVQIMSKRPARRLITGCACCQITRGPCRFCWCRVAVLPPHVALVLQARLTS